ncbi:6-pyruvoyl trahydropterin synthase family protein [Cesiribacter andamanensis]|uniref:6-carboxy-5,6,7,8-tetrahydropterin synthase n=1 Tax=Cesiribacter andamanensis AMV16 TaxID=1279009 RepID=M7N2G8_9BACT|nr:6-carboxytetrahydropterin synthase [Cesiribacter andamanensis]EMR01497.1 queuosine biosynthesis protein QueD [Cesiribacter andamanensis AMV16]
MKVSKKFRWEGAHRIAWHTEGCQHLHGHSYVLWVEVEGPTGDKGMLMDFKVLKKVLKPLIAAWDHATLIARDDVRLKEAIDHLDSKFYLLPYDSTAENMCRYITDYLLQQGAAELAAHRIHTLTVRIQETESCFAELRTPVDVETLASHLAPGSWSATPMVQAQ